ncbi:MAG TPA: hypothetical protein VML94_05340 [Thermoplasmata archaeon]|nr:hypothetical protein [Thermoplasmata archaeon]
MAPGEDPPAVELPERLDRPLRLGPFRSARDALKCVAYAAVGALLVPFLGPLVWIPFAVVGVAASLGRTDGGGVDDRAVRYLFWRARRLVGGVGVTPGGESPTGRRAIVRLPSSFAAVVRVGGLPLAYLPAADLTRCFERYRELLRAFDGSFLVHSTRAPIHPTPFLPAEPTPGGPEGAARAGYRELVEVIVRRRHVRQVFLAIATGEPGPDGIARLETQVATLLDRLRALGLRPARLRDRALSEAIRRLGLTEVGASR